MVRHLCLAVFLLATAWAGSAAAEVVHLKTRDTHIHVLIEGPAKPSAVVVIFSGGDGDVQFTDDGTITKGAQNFAVRTRMLLQQHGLATAVLSTPDDNRDLRLFAASSGYAEDVENVMAMLRARFPGVPIWMHGTSRGTVSIAEAAPKIKNPANRPDGIVFSSSVTERSKYDVVFDGDLAGLTMAVLVLQHKDDPCYVTPPDGAEKLLQALTRAKPKRLVMIAGGGAHARGADCMPHSHHGFIDVEAEAIDTMVDFIRTPR